MEDWSVIVPPVVLLSGALLLLNFHSKFEDRRVNRKVRFADSFGLTFVGEGIPGDFPSAFLDALPARSERRDGILGWHHGELVAAFEYERNFGRGENWNSVVAVRQHSPQPFRGRLPFGCLAASYGEWAIIYSNTVVGRRLSTKRIAELWASMRTTSDEEAQDLQIQHAVQPGTVIRPRGNSLNL